MKRILKVVGVLLLLLLIAGLGAYAWAKSQSSARYDKSWEVHDASFPIPFPLSEAELEDLRRERAPAALAVATEAGGAPPATPATTDGGAAAPDPLAGLDLDAIALERAVKRGEHIVHAWAGCFGCHGDDFGGKVLVDVPIVGYWGGPNLTTGKGSVVEGYTPQEWDRAVRHGLRRDGRSSSMPSEEFRNLSDRELSDIVAYLRSVPPVDRDIGRPRFGPVFAIMGATDPRMFPAYGIDHQKAHPESPPAQQVSVELGAHMTQVCVGCHGANLSGGKMEGDPNMPIVANITPHETGLEGWKEEDFIRSMREGKRPDGSDVNPAMPWQAYGKMTDTELKAVWAYLQTVPPAEKGVH